MLHHRKAIVSIPSCSAAPCPACSAGNQMLVLIVNYPNSPTPVVRGHHDGKQIVLHSLLSCPSCSFIYFHPRPSAETLQDMYRKNDMSSKRTEEDFLKILNSHARYSVVLSEIDWILDKIPAGEEKGRAIDVGCLHGIFLRGLKHRGFDIFGIEPDIDVSALVRKHLQCEIFCGLLEDYDCLGKHFNLVTMIDTLEHHLNPFRSICEASSLLKYGGVLYISVPNINSFSAQHDINFYPGVEFPSHLNYFNASSLSAAVRRAGLTIVACDTFSRPADMFHANDIAQKYNASYADSDFLDMLYATHQLDNLRLLARKN